MGFNIYGKGRSSLGFSVWGLALTGEGASARGPQVLWARRVSRCSHPHPHLGLFGLGCIKRCIKICFRPVSDLFTTFFPLAVQGFRFRVYGCSLV